MTAAPEDKKPSRSMEVRKAWRTRKQTPDVREFLSPDLSNEEVVEVLLADCEERHERALNATVEHYRDLGIPVSDAAFRALLMAEFVRRESTPTEALREEIAARFPEHRELAALCLDICRSPAELVPGARFGTYRLEHVLGRGSFGTVWQAFDERLCRRIALKLLRPRTEDLEESREAALAEARAAARVRHQNVVAIHAVGEFPELGLDYIVSELVGDPAPTPEDPHGIRVGTTLSRHSRKPDGSALPEREIASLLRDIALAVAAAHARGVIHRDLKPANIVVTPSGRPMVTDFGISKASQSPSGEAPRDEGDAAEVETRRIAGTPVFMAPEQACGEPTTPLTDIFGLGATLYDVAAGHPPYLAGATGVEGILDAARAGVIATPRRPIPRRLDQIMRKAMARDPAHRYLSAALMARDLDAVATLRPTSFDGQGALTALRWFARRNPARVGAALMIAVLAAVLIAGYLRERWGRQVLLDHDEARRLLASQDSLWPRRERFLPRLGAWDQAASALEKRLPRGSEVARNLERAHATAKEALRVARTIATETASGWEPCLSALAADPAFAQSLRAPPVGLRPLGRDATTSLHEFWQVETGEQPVFSGDPARGRTLPGKDSALVYVLVPGGTIRASESEPPVTLLPFLISKYEVTQEQYLRIMGSSPSQFGVKASDPSFQDHHPVEMVTRADALEFARRIEATLPTRMQWLHAAQLLEPSTLALAPRANEFANLADRSWKLRFHEKSGGIPALDDRFPLHAPVGSFQANRFGLHDVLGNVWEWSVDHHSQDPAPRPHDGRDLSPESGIALAFGGGFESPFDHAINPRLGKLKPDYRAFDIGFRPVMNLSLDP